MNNTPTNPRATITERVRDGASLPSFVGVYFRHGTQERGALRIDRNDSADGLAGSVLGFVRGAVAAIALLTSGIHLLASLSVAVFLYVFHEAQS
jgi:hypothetical protein